MKVKKKDDSVSVQTETMIVKVYSSGCVTIVCGKVKMVFDDSTRERLIDVYKDGEDLFEYAEDQRPNA